MKRKIIILHFNMELGGAESSLLGLLDTIDYDRYDVDLFLYAHEGELMSMLNPNARLLPEMKAYRALTESMKQNFAQGCIPIGMARAAAKVRSSLSRGPMQSGHNYKQYFHKLCIPYLPVPHRCFSDGLLRRHREGNVGDVRLRGERVGCVQAGV